MSKQWLNHASVNHFVCSEKLYDRDGLTAIQRMFLMKLCAIQAKGIGNPYISQSILAEKNGVSWLTVHNHILKLIEEGIVTNLGQVDQGLACSFRVSDWFMEEIGYEPYEEPQHKAPEAVQEEETSKDILYPWKPGQSAIEWFNEHRSAFPSDGEAWKYHSQLKRESYVEVTESRQYDDDNPF